MLGKRILQRRLELKLNQKELAQKANISVTYLSELERNKSYPSVRVCVDIANALGVSIDYLLQDMAKESGQYRLSEYSKRIQRLKSEDQRIVMVVMDAMITHLD